MPDWHRSLRVIALLVTRAPRHWVTLIRLMPPAYVKPYVKRQKNDATDAEAICEAVTMFWRRLWPRASLTRRSPIRAQLLGLDRASTEAALEWWQGQARQYQQTR